VQRKEKANSKLKDHKQEIKQTQESDKQIMQTHFESTLKRAESVFLEKEGQLTEKNGVLSKSVHVLDEFKVLRKQLADELNETREKIDANESWHRQQLDDLERKFLAARDRLEKEASARIAHSRKVYKEEVGRELDEDSKRVRQENSKMGKELEKQEETSNRLQASRERMTQTIRRLQMDLDLAKQKGVEYNRRHERQHGSLTNTQDRTKVLERSLMHVLRECEVEREDRDMQERKELEDASGNLEQLKLEAASKSEEMKFLTSHAKTVLRQRAEVERYFLEEIQKCDEHVKNRRMLEHKAAKVNHNRAIRSLATVPDGEGFWGAGMDRVNSKPEVLRLEVEPIEVLGLDRGRLLRLIYSKLNNHDTVQQRSYPAHSFEVKDDSRSQLRPDSQDSQRSGLSIMDRTTSRPPSGRKTPPAAGSFFLTQESR
jgi:hypothetical protein